MPGRTGLSPDVTGHKRTTRTRFHMLSYFCPRRMLIIPTFLGITLLVFTITRFVPGGRSSACCCRPRSRRTSPAAPAAARGRRRSPTSRDRGAQGLLRPRQAHADRLLGVAAEAGGAGSRRVDPQLRAGVGSHQERLPVTAFFRAGDLSAELCRLHPAQGWPRRSGTTAASIR